MKNCQINAIFLAAGNSKRMDENKISLPLGSTTIGSFGLRRFIQSNINHIFVVTKVNDSLDWIDRDLFQLPYKKYWTHVPCINANHGQSHSLNCGLNEALKFDSKGIMILLADQPFLSIETINTLHFNYLELLKKDSTIPFLAASFQGIPRPPIIFSPISIPSLLKLTGDEGARKIVRMHKRLDDFLIDFEDKIDFFDIDTKEAYVMAKRIAQSKDNDDL